MPPKNLKDLVCLFNDLLLALLLVFFGALEAYAHEGPPFPILVDHTLSDNHSLSIWTDPDVGIGTFIFLISTNSTKSENSPDTQKFLVKVSATPSQSLGSEVTSAVAKPEPLLAQQSGKSVYVAEVPFSHEGFWRVEFSLSLEESPQPFLPIQLDVEVTPPGPQRWELWVSLTPFILFGGLWLTLFYRRRSLKKTRAANSL